MTKFDRFRKKHFTGPLQQSHVQKYLTFPGTFYNSRRGMSHKTKSMEFAQKDHYRNQTVDRGFFQELIK